MFELSPEQLQQLDSNIKKMLGAGASQSDVESYAADFKNKYAKKKSSQSVSDSGSSDQSISQSTSSFNSGIDETFPTAQNLTQKYRNNELPVITPTEEQQFQNDQIFNYAQTFGNPIVVLPNNAVIGIDKRTIPVSLAPGGNDPVLYTQQLNERIKSGKETEQDKIVIQKNINPVTSFTAQDSQSLSELTTKNGIETFDEVVVPPQISMFLPSVEGKTFGELRNTPEGQFVEANLIKDKIKSQIFALKEADSQERRNLKPSDNATLSKITELQQQLEEANGLSEKLAFVITPVSQETEIANIRTDESGSLLRRLKNLVPTNVLSEPSASFTEETLPPEFMTGLNYQKLVEPVVYARLIKDIETGAPISESQKAQINARGLEIQEDRLKQSYKNQQIDQAQYQAAANELQDKRYNNIVGNKEVLRSFLSNGIANLADQNNVIADAGKNTEGLAISKIFGHRWNYSDEEILGYGKMVAKAAGIDENDARVQEAIKYLQNNEGAMILDNSIAKSGFVRDFFKGAASPIRGIANSISDIPRSSDEVYAESQSQGNVNVSEQRLNRINNSWEGTVAAVAEGTGQFVTQAGLAVATSSVLGGLGSQVLGRAGVAALEGDIAIADLGATDLIGRTLLQSKDALATYITSYAQSYDSNLKTALSYTDNNSRAKQVAAGMSFLEGATEQFLSPIEIARGIKGKLFGNAEDKIKGILGVLSDASILEKQTAISNLLKSTLNGGLETIKVAGSEIGEELVTQLADFGANAILNPNSQSFQNRDLANEIVNTTNQTGLSMAIPALLSGIGSANVNNFSKGTLLIAAQNRQHLIDDMNKRLHDGSMSQDEYNQKVLIINTAATANETLLEKADGEKLNSAEKVDYIFSRTSEAVLNKKLDNSKDEAEKNTLKDKIKSQQDFRIGLLRNETPVVAESSIPVAEAQAVTNADVPIKDEIKITDVISSDKAKAITTALSATIRGESINENDINAAQDNLYVALDANPNAAHLIEPLILRLQNYDNTTKTQTGTVTETQATERLNKVERNITPALEHSEGSSATITRANGETIDGTLNIINGNYVINNADNNPAIIGEKAQTDISLKLPSIEKLENPISFDADGNVSAVTFETNKGDLVTVNNPEKALDIAIQLQADAVGEIPDAAFDKVYEEVAKEVNAEIPTDRALAATAFTPNETQGEALSRLTKGIEYLPPERQDAEIERRAAEHNKSYQAIAENGISSENKSLQRVNEFGKLTANAMRDFIKNPAKFEGINKTFENGSRIDENGDAISENDFVSLKEKVKELRKDGNTEEIKKINNAPRAYLNTNEESTAKRLSSNDTKSEGQESAQQISNADIKNKSGGAEAAASILGEGQKMAHAATAETLKAKEIVNVALTPKEAFDKIKSGELKYNEAIENKNSEYIDSLDKELSRKGSINFNEDAFKEQIRKQKAFGLNQDEVFDVFGSTRSLTKQQKAIIDGVFGETAVSDKVAKELQDAFKALAAGEKPKSVIKRLSLSDVGTLASALKDISYKAISNAQLEKMADYVVDSIELSKADRFINGIIDNTLSDMRQLLRAKLIVALQDSGNKGLATQMISDMADEATTSGRQTQSLKRAYEILGAKGNPATRTAFQVKYAESVRETAARMTKNYAEAISQKDAEISTLNQKIHKQAQKSPTLINRIKETIAKLCKTRNK